MLVAFHLWHDYYNVGGRISQEINLIFSDEDKDCLSKLIPHVTLTSALETKNSFGLNFKNLLSISSAKNLVFLTMLTDTVRIVWYNLDHKHLSENLKYSLYFVK